MPTPASTLRPAGFHGQGHLRRHAHGRAPRGSYFEGWYVKLVSADRRTRLALIPGVFLSEDGRIAESFVQVLDGMTGATAYHRFDLAEFEAAPDRFAVRVGPNHFDASGVRVDLPGLRADVRFGPPVAWPVTVREPGAMGWYAWVPTMECYHGVVSLDHGLAGWIETEAGRADLVGGRGYLEKDWGTAFPRGYVWIQSNHFATPGLSLVASTALIPWRRSAFRGDLVGLRVPPGGTGPEGGRPEPRLAGLHRFTSYTRARTLALAVEEQHVSWTIGAPDGRALHLEASVEGRTTGLLHAPVRTEMHQRVAETLDGMVTVRLVDSAGRTLLEDAGECAGVEVHGDIAALLATPGR
ncbi:MAG TPA: tocopherol cyclase family protein [Candidatus Nanopelagicales bacterium]